MSKDRKEPLDPKQRKKRRTFIMKKRLFSLALASVMALSLAGCGGSQEAATAAGTKAETEQAAADTSAKAEDTAAEAETRAEGETASEAAEGSGGGTLIVGFDQDFPPMGFMGDDGEYTGFDLELAQEVAKKVKGIHYPLLVAAAYVGNAFCLVGISGTIALNVAGGWNFEGVWSTTGIPFRETVFAPYNLFIYVVGAIVLCLLITAMHPSPEKTKTVDPSIFNEVSAAKVYKSPSEMTPAEKLETSVLLNGAITCIGFFCVIWSFVDSLYIKKQSFSLSINQVNMIFLFASIAMYKTPVRTVEAVKKSLGGAVGVVLQMPFYAGIAGLISYNGGSTGVSIAQVIAGFFVHISNAQTFPLFTCLSAVIVKLFVPSGGAQWAVQGPIVMQAVQSFMPAVSEGKAAMALSWGNSCCNLLQPFWLIPVLEVAKLKVRDVMGYCVICLIALLVIISAGLLFL